MACGTGIATICSAMRCRKIDCTISTVCTKSCGTSTSTNLLRNLLRSALLNVLISPVADNGVFHVHVDTLSPSLARLNHHRGGSRGAPPATMMDICQCRMRARVHKSCAFQRNWKPFGVRLCRDEVLTGARAQIQTLVTGTSQWK